jgi:hypothetical protein
MDKLRKIKNSIRLVGKLAEAKIRQGKNKDGIPYVSVDGQVQFGEDKIYTKRFKMYVQEYRVDDSGKKEVKKTYQPLVKFIETYGENTIANVGYDDAVRVNVFGSFGANDYVSATEELQESVEIKGWTMRLASCTEKDQFEPTVEGVIRKIAPEVVNETETGRKRLDFLTVDAYQNAIILKNLIAEGEGAEFFEDNDEAGVGATITLNLSVAAHASTAPKKTGGFGEKRTDERPYLEMIIAGCDDPVDVDSDKYISKATVKALLNERQIRLDELKEKGYQGGNNESGNSKIRTANFGSAKTAKDSASKVNPSDDDDDVDF